MRGVCLLGVLLTARAATLIGYALPLSFWSPFAYLWQDVLVALLFVGGPLVVHTHEVRRHLHRAHL